MRKLFGVIASAAFVSGFLQSQAVADDPDPSLDPHGWGPYTWGMTYEQVLQKSGGHDLTHGTEIDRARNGAAIEATTVVDGMSATVHFDIGCGNIGLKNLYLTFDEGTADWGIEAKLFQRYGVPSTTAIQGNDAQNGYYANWDFPTTEVHYDRTLLDSRTGKEVRIRSQYTDFREEAGYTAEPHLQNTDLQYCDANGNPNSVQNGF